MSRRVNPNYVYLVNACTPLRKKSDHVKSIQDISCHVCSSTNHFTQDCLTLPALKESLREQSNVRQFQKVKPYLYS